jgi:hypothetical protein
MLTKLSAILNQDRHVQVDKHKSLKKILKALKRERSALEESLSETHDIGQKNDIEARLKIVSAQHEKGLDVLKGLNKDK